MFDLMAGSNGEPAGEAGPIWTAGVRRQRARVPRRGLHEEGPGRAREGLPGGLVRRPRPGRFLSVSTELPL